MRSQLLSPVGVFALFIIFAADCPRAAVYYGNGNTDSGGAVGLGNFNLTANGTSVSATFQSGSGMFFGQNLVVFIDSLAGGFGDTTSFTDNADVPRASISGLAPWGPRSTSVFANGFSADYAFVLVSQNLSQSGLYRLVGTADGHELIAPLLVNDHGGTGSYTVTFNWQDIGLGQGGGDGFRFEANYVTDRGLRSGESFEALTMDSRNWGNTITFSAFDTFEVVPETTTAALGIFGGLLVGGGLVSRVRRYFSLAAKR